MGCGQMGSLANLKNQRFLNDMFGSDTVSSSVPCIVGLGWPLVSLVARVKRSREFRDKVKRAFPQR